MKRLPQEQNCSSRGFTQFTYFFLKKVRKKASRNINRNIISLRKVENKLVIPLSQTNYGNKSQNCPEQMPHDGPGGQRAHLDLTDILFMQVSNYINLDVKCNKLKWAYI